MTLPRYKVRILPQARRDIDRLYKYIDINLSSTMTARRYRRGIYNTINGLSLTGNIVAFSGIQSLQEEYGPNVRTAIYKKVSIIYVVRGNVVVVHSVVASSTIK